MKTNPIELVIEPRKSDLGDGFFVRRAIPYAKKRMVGPFIFFDHMGPAILTKENPLSVRSHPHIGLSTLTYLFEGEMLHRDSLGNELTIRPGAVNWMTAGRGIVHSERSNPETPMNIEGIQLWIALPKAFEEIEPSFVHVDEKDIPEIEIGNSIFNLVAGSAFGKKSPVPVYSPLFYLNGKMQCADTFKLEVDEKSEGAVYVSSGKITCGDQEFIPGQMVCFTQGSTVEFTALEESHVLVLGGEIFPEKRFIFWNFVSSSEERLEQAKHDWHNDKFPKVINETDRIPLPDGAFRKTF